MATENQIGKARRKLLECSVCLNHMSNRVPRALPCLHTFCETCLVECAKQCMPDSITCPTCRVSSRLPDGGIKKLPHNFLINQVIDSLNEEPECENCIETCKSRVAATDFCKQCQKSLCTKCISYHDTIPLFQTHQVLKISVDRQSDDIDVCSLHDKPLGIYCPECVQCICASCALNPRHKGHQDTFKDIGKEFETFGHIVADKTKSMTAFYDLHMKKVEKAIVHIKQMDKKIFEEGEKRKKNIDDQVETLRQDLNHKFLKPAQLNLSELKEFNDKLGMLKHLVDDRKLTVSKLSKLKLYLETCKRFNEKMEVKLGEHSSVPDFEVSLSVPTVGTISSGSENTTEEQTKDKRPSLEERNALMTRGTRVKVGPDWDRKSWTPPGEGTVSGACAWKKDCAVVRFDGFYGNYLCRVGAEGCYDIQLA